MKLEKIKLTDLVNEQLTNKELELLKGGEYANGCGSFVCSKNLDNRTQYCTNGDGICSSRMKI